MRDMNYPTLYGHIEYLEQTLNLFKKALADRVESQVSSFTTLFGSLGKTNLSLNDFKKTRKTLSNSWKAKWTT